MTLRVSYERGTAAAFYKAARLKDDVTLQPHQVDVERSLQDNPGMLLYHGLGSGKTLSSIAGTEGMKTDVVVPAALRENYKKELGKFTTTPQDRNVMSYEAATKGIQDRGEALVLDEAHRLGNSSSKRSQALIDAAPNYKRRILLTGTPIRNRPHELAPLMRVLDPENKDLPLDPGMFNQRFIREESIDPGFLRRFFLGMKPGTEEHGKNLDVIGRAFRGKVHYYQPDKNDFPDRQDELVKVPMGDEQYEIYKTILNKADPILARKVRSNFPLNKREAQGLNSFLVGPRIASNSPEAFGGKTPSAKLQRALDDFLASAKENPNHKALTYSNFLEGGVDQYAKMLEAQHVPHGVFHGGISDAERKRLVEEYNAGKIRNLLITGAGSEGLDLKGTRDVQLLEPHWNDPRLEQATGRAIRFGSHSHLPEEERNVRVRRYLSTIPKNFLQRTLGTDPDTSADEYLYGLSKKKEALNNEFLDVLKQEGGTR